MSRIHPLEPWFFLLFGAFHLHRVWALADRAGYAAFWMGLLEQKGPLYFLLMGALALLCLWGAALFFRERRQPRWWRWAYVLGGGSFALGLWLIRRRRKESP